MTSMENPKIKLRGIRKQMMHFGMVEFHPNCIPISEYLIPRKMCGMPVPKIRATIYGCGIFQSTAQARTKKVDMRRSRFAFEKKSISGQKKNANNVYL